MYCKARYYESTMHSTMHYAGSTSYRYRSVHCHRPACQSPAPPIPGPRSVRCPTYCRYLTTCPTYVPTYILVPRLNEGPALHAFSVREGGCLWVM